MLVLGVESSCDETGAALVDETGRVVCDIVHSQVATHALYGGVVPELASRDHLRSIGPVVREALARGGVTLAEVDGIAVTNRPGLVGALLVGVQAAKGLAWAAGKPLVGVDHLLGHVLAVFLRREGTGAGAGVGANAGVGAGANAGAGAADPATPRFPFVCLLVSGGHTAIYRVDAPRPDGITELGATRDDAAGEAFDKVAKLLGLGYPGGPAIDRLAPSGDPTRVTLSAPMTARGSLQMSFSGIKTQVAQLVAREGPVTGQRTADICAAFQTAVTSSLANKVIDAAVQEGVEDVVLGGGVAANRELRRRTEELGASRGIRVLVPPLASCTDNAAMIAYAGALRLARGERDTWDLVATSETALPRETRKGRGKR